jgi:hypothetical protein
MRRASLVLSVSALLMSVIAYAITHLGFPGVGFEGALLLGGALLWLSGLCVILACSLCMTLAIKQHRAGLIWPLIASVLAVAVLALASGLLRV